MRMLRWMCGVTKNDKSRTEPCERISKRSTSHKEYHRENAKVAEKGRGKNDVRCASTRIEMDRNTENQVERRLQKIYGKC